MSDIEAAFKAIPPVTRGWLVAAMVSTVSVVLKLVNPYSLILDLGLVWSKFQVWRLFTAYTFFGTFSMGFVFQLFIL